MIIYATKQTFERYKMQHPDDISSPLMSRIGRRVLSEEQGNGLHEWGAKLFYFQRRKCIHVVNFESKLTFFLIDVKVDDVLEIGNSIVYYIFNLYEGNAEMEQLIDRHFTEHPAAVFSRLTNMSVITTLNQTYLNFLRDGVRLYDYFDNNILMTRKLNNDVNRKWIFGKKVNGKKDYIIAAEEYEKLLKAYYANR